MSQVELTQLQWAGSNLRRIGLLGIDTEEIVARAETDSHSVLYLRSGEKLLVRESLAEIDRVALLSRTEREVGKRFKREMRERRAMGMSIEQAFAGLWDEVSARVRLSEAEEADLYNELLNWTKRWLK